MSSRAGADLHMQERGCVCPKHLSVGSSRLPGCQATTKAENAIPTAVNALGAWGRPCFSIASSEPRRGLVR